MAAFCTPTYDALPGSSTTVEGTEIPEWVAAAGKGLFQKAASIANEEYPAFTGPRTMDYGGSKLTQEERQGMDILRGGAESYLPYMNRDGEVADTLGRGYDGMSQQELLGDPFQGATREELLGDYQGATREELMGDPFSLESAQPYMDIYQSAMNPAVREIEEQTLRAQNDARARASTGGGGFGSRLGIMEGTVAGEGAQAAGDLRAGAAREGLGFAAGRFDTERQARMGTEQQMRSGFEADRRYAGPRYLRN